MRIIRPLLMLIIVISIAAGCRKELCYEHPHKGSVTVNVNWKNLPASNTKPTGVRVVFIRQESDLVHSFNFPSDGGSRTLSQGLYKILTVNNDSELVMFRNMTKWNELEAFTAVRRQVPYKAAPMNVPQSQVKSEARYGISGADIVMVSNSETVDVTENPEDRYVVEVIPESKVIPITIRIPVSGMKNVAEARGFITGVSTSYFMGIDSLNQAESTLLFDYGSAALGTELKTDFHTFGFVNEPTKSGRFIVGLEVLLIDQSVIYYEFEVSAKVEPIRKTGGVILIDQHIVVPDVDGPAPGGGGFKPGIDDWENEEKEIPIG